MLKVEKLNVHYGVIHALKDVSMEVKEGEIVSLIGANGAGKTTLLQTISGLLKKTSGEVVFLGKSMNKVSAKNIVKEGITQVPEGRHIFSGMSVYENLLMGAYLRKDKDGIKADLQDIYSGFRFWKAKLTGCFHLIRRRTADAGDGKGTDGPAEDSAAG